MNGTKWKTATAELDNTRLCYGEMGSGPPILLIHGTGYGADMWGGPFRRTFSFVDPDGYTVTVHDG